MNNPKKRLGTYSQTAIAGEKVQAYIPPALPPDPPLGLDSALLELLEKSNHSLGRLDAISTMLPDTKLFLYMFIRKEAVLSSQIEGTQSSLSDLLLYERREGKPISPDVEEVSLYVKAMEHGIERLKEGFPLSLRLLKEIHGILLSGGRGSQKAPGEFRQSQNWIGGTRPGNARFVPPPAHLVLECMGQLEKFLHNDPQPTPPLIKAALSHVQFETIHPFLDGNGRLGRLLITLLLCTEGILKEPVLYLSLYFKIHRLEYYDRLQNVRTEGDWEGWTRFFLEGINMASQEAVTSAQNILQVFEEDRQKIQTLKRASISAMAVHEYIRKNPFFSMSEIRDHLKITFPTARSTVMNLEKLGIVKETTDQQRNKVYNYTRYWAILSEGTNSPV